MKLKDIDILRVGHEIQIAGAVFADSGNLYLCLLPDEPAGGRKIETLDMDSEDWKKFIQQTDMLETEVLAKAKDGTLAKIILRKSARQVDQGVSWKVFKRDGYACAYCGAEGIPLSVDHLVTWEDGGPTIEDNLLTACRKCNKTRSNLSYADWLKHPFYLKVSQNLTAERRQKNQGILATLDRIPRKYHVNSR